MCVEVDLTKPLLSKFTAKMKVRRIEYEGMYQICFHCGVYGHAAEACPRKPSEEGHATAEAGGAKGNDGRQPNKESDQPVIIRPEIVERYGTWMIAPKKMYRQNRSNNGKNKDQKGKDWDGAKDPNGSMSGEKGSQNGKNKGKETVDQGIGSASMFAALSEDIVDETIELTEESNEGNQLENQVRKVGKSVGKNREKVRRPNVQISEKQITNEKNVHPGATQVMRKSHAAASTEASTSKRPSKSNQAAAGDTHTVARGIGADDTCIKLGFDQWLRVEAVGMSGGKWILWNNSLKLDVLSTNPQFVTLEITNSRNMVWSIAVVYASPSHNLRHKLWSDLGRTQHGLDEAWIAIGDFNSIRNSEEVYCRESFNERRSREFIEWISRESLIDLGFSGSQYTWRRGTTVETFKAARLDRCLCTEAWIDKFPNATVSHIPNLTLDHNPVLLTLENQTNYNRPNRFQYQAVWGLHKDFGKIVTNTWRSSTNTGLDFDSKLNLMKENLKTEKGGDWRLRKKKRKQTIARIDGIQRARNYGKKGGLIKLEAKLKTELDDILYKEELIWFQRSREEWITSSDCNTKYYHAIKKEHFRALFMRETTTANTRNVTKEEIKPAAF
ncbi:PREDICTED: uncharacterized protein LOC109170322 [Ipomoea nil]|uniref:uncharacterized protein LOC109170322 n=1 Tax=Ipomoea nil TaxID=35883 RepID=UPI000900C956|nr:PREDICTED: uncharacterized protein LOC109170322 [Ipomoea nil]